MLAGVGDHPCFLTFISMIHIACIFLTLVCKLLKVDYNNYFLACAQLLISRNPLASALHFQPITQHYKQKTA